MIKRIYFILFKPWPSFSFFLILIAIISSIVPYIQVITINNIVVFLQQRNGVNFNIIISLIIFSLSIFIDLMLKNRNFLTYICKIMEFKIRKRYYKEFIYCVSRNKYERIDDSVYLDNIKNIKDIFEKDMIIPLLNLQRTVVFTASLIVVYIQLGKASILIPLILIIGNYGNYICQKQLSNKEWKAELKNTESHRYLKYLQKLLVDKDKLPELRIYKLNDYLIRKWEKKSRHIVNNDYMLLKDYNKIKYFIFILQVLINMIVYYLLIHSYFNNQIVLGELMGLMILISQIDLEISPLFQRFTTFYIFFKKMSHLLLFIDESEQNNNKNKVELPNIEKSSIIFENVSFKYPNTDRYILKNVSFEIKPQEIISIVGENGSGKSTIVKLLLKLYIPTKGNIYIGEINIQDIPIDVWLRYISVNIQNYIKYEFEVRKNIYISDYKYKDDVNKIYGAAKLSGASEFIESLPQKYKTQLGVKEFEGVNLSGGQWQKIALSRAFFKNSPIIILDEPTSSLDPISEIKIYKKLLNFSKGKTAVLISHRLGTARYADKVIYIYNGKVRNVGKHDYLMEIDKCYKELYESQAKWYLPNKEMNNE